MFLKHGIKLSVPRIILALLLLVFFDCWLGSAHPLKNAVTPNLDRTETFGSLEAYKKLPVKPDLVLLGSSVVVAPVMQAESLLLNKPIVRFKHRESTYLEKNLDGKLPARPNIFCFAVAGAAVSDVHTIVRRLLVDQKNGDRPLAIVYGIAPRDFQDNTWPGVESTEVFQVLANTSDAFELAADRDITLDRKINVVLGRLSSFWKYRSDMRLLLTLRIKKLMERTMPWVVFDKYGETLELKPRKHGQFPEEAKGELRVFPGIAMENVGEKRTVEQYINRYRPLNKNNVDLQFHYLDKILSLCREARITPIIVNMPLSRANLALLPADFYREYKGRLATVCANQGAQLIDMQRASYEASDFYADTVHMTPEVSRMFLDDLAGFLAKSRVASLYDRKATSGLADSGRQAI